MEGNAAFGCRIFVSTIMGFILGNAVARVHDNLCIAAPIATSLGDV